MIVFNIGNKSMISAPDIFFLFYSRIYFFVNIVQTVFRNNMIAGGLNNKTWLGDFPQVFPRLFY